MSTNPDSKLSILKRVRRLSHLLDSAILIPGTTFRIGLDPLLGLIPGAGDIVGTALSAYIVLEAARLGLPHQTLTRMVSNILFETVVGALPVVGDLVDATWKANVRNVALLEAHLNVPQSGSKANRWFLVLLLGGLMLVVIGLVALSVVVIKLLWRATNS